MPSKRESISMVACVDEESVRLARSHCPQTPDSAIVASQVLATILPLEVLDAEVDNTIVKVLASKVGVTSSCFHLEDAILNCQQRDIEGASSHVIDQDVALTRGL